MAKNTSKTATEETATVETPVAEAESAGQPNTSMVRATARDLSRFDGSASLLVNLEQTTMLDIIRTLRKNVDVERYTAEVTGAVPYWMAEQGAAIAARIVNRFEVKTEYGMCGLYTVELQSPATAVKQDGEVVQLKEGDQMVVLERFLLKKFSEHVGHDVIVVCEGQRMTKKGNKLWGYQWAWAPPMDNAAAQKQLSA
jgi:hypothetical protein